MRKTETKTAKIRDVESQRRSKRGKRKGEETPSRYQSIQPKTPDARRMDNEISRISDTQRVGGAPVGE